MDLIKKLNELSDKDYALFQAKLTPSVDKDLFIGVRVPLLRNFAKEFIKDKDCDSFLNVLPHKYYDENMLHAILISLKKDYNEVITLVNKFLPYVDNWAVCDILSPKIFKKHLNDLIDQIKIWVESSYPYEIRFGIEMLMSFYLDSEFKEEYLNIALVKHEEYYVKMMVSWFYATALAKQWDSTISYITNNLLDTWCHNKTISKAIESYRITDEQKEMLRKLKR